MFQTITHTHTHTQYSIASHSLPICETGKLNQTECELLPEFILNTERCQWAAVVEVLCGVHQGLWGPITHPDQLWVLYNTFITAKMKKNKQKHRKWWFWIDYRITHWACWCRSVAAGDRHSTIRRLRKILAVKYCIASVSSLGKSRFMEGAKACKKNAIL